MSWQGTGPIGVVALLLSTTAAAQTSPPERPFRLEEVLSAPDWLSIRGETRARYETLSGQFRARGTGGDQILVFRTLALGEADTGPITLGLELQDSRAYLDDSGTPLTTTIVNPLDVLQA
ncbi:MAG: hypothetical protein ACOYKM_11850 [Caulobacterales bacterium]|jgi:hypothetical protein